MADRNATEAPTPKRKREARKEGRIPKSPDLAAWGTVLVGVSLLPGTFQRVLNVARHNLNLVAGNIDGGQQLPELLGQALWDAALAMAPLLLGVWVLAFVVTVAQVGFVLTGKTLKPKAERLSPAKNIKRIVGIRGVVELVKQLLKTTIIIAVGWGMVTSIAGRLSRNGSTDLLVGLHMTLDNVVALMRWCGGAALILAFADYGYQRWQTMKDMRMTKQEVRDESKQTDGDPLIKQRIRMLQREAARRRMLADVTEATAVIVNPTHIAIALRYDPARDSAPRIVAKGRGKLADKIRQTATDNRIPIVRAIPLARAMDRHCEVGDTVPASLFDAVARVLAFLRRMGDRLAWMDVVELPARWRVEIPDLGRPQRRRR